MDLIPFSISEFSLETYLIKISPGAGLSTGLLSATIIFSIAILPFIYVDVSVQAQRILSIRY